MEQASLQFEYDLTAEEEAVYALLQKGRENAVSSRALAERTDMSNVQIRQICRNLIVEHGILVASATDDPPGFFIARTRDEILAATKSLRHRGISILYRAAKLQRAGIEIVFNLARLEFEEKKHDTA